MHIYINHELKRALVTFPKIAGTSIENVLLWRTSQTRNIHPNIKGWRTAQSDNNENFFDLVKVRALIPTTYKTTVMYRDPLERYISGFNYLFLDTEQMDMLNISDDGVDPTDSTLIKKWSSFDDAWYENWIEYIFRTSYYNPGLDDNHTKTILLVAWILWWEFDAELLYINDLNDWIKNVHSLPNDLEIPKSNVSLYGYTQERNKNVLRIISHKFDRILREHDLVKDYLAIDRVLFDHMHNNVSSKPQDFQNMWRWIVSSVYNLSSPGQNDIVGNMAKYQHYLLVLTDWANHGTTVDSSMPDTINTHITQLTQSQQQVMMAKRKEI